MTRTARALTIASSDSGGGAGIQADLRAFAAAGCHGSSAIVALTAQNTREVRGVHEVPAAFVVAQVAAVFDDIGVDAVKTGMLFSAEIVEAVAASLRGRGVPIVVDPVMVASSGARLLQADAVEVMVTRLFPLATVVTPNLPEAEMLTGQRAGSRAELAERLHAMGAAAVIVTGGHGAEPVDHLFDGTSHVEIAVPRHAVAATHGAGCTHSATLAALLAQGWPLERGRARGGRCRCARGGLRARRRRCAATVPSTCSTCAAARRPHRSSRGAAHERRAPSRPASVSTGDSLRRIRAQRPLVHQITNFVVMNETANATLAIGALPVMAHAPEEVAEMAAVAGALVLNIGTLTTEWVESMLVAARAANAARSAGRPRPRRRRCDRAAHAERAAHPVERRGRDRAGQRCRGGHARRSRRGDPRCRGGWRRRRRGRPRPSRRPRARVRGGGDRRRRRCERRRPRRCASPTDTPLLATVTGTGCIASALTGCFAAVNRERPLAAAAEALVALGVAGEDAAAVSRGPGSFHVALYDALYALSPETIDARARVTAE